MSAAYVEPEFSEHLDENGYVIVSARVGMHDIWIRSSLPGRLTDEDWVNMQCVLALTMDEYQLGMYPAWKRLEAQFLANHPRITYFQDWEEARAAYIRTGEQRYLDEMLSHVVLGEDRYDDVYSPPEASPSVDRTLSWIRVAVALCVVAALVTLPTVFTGLS